MRGQYEERAKEEAMYIIDNNATIRQAATAFSVSKSTIHLDVTERLKVISPVLYDKCRKVLEKNKAEKAMRGGQSTKKKYLRIKAEKQH